MENQNAVTVAQLQDIIIENADHEANEREVDQFNDEGVALLMKTQTEESLRSFLRALYSCGNDAELQAKTLINIGDFQRRVPGHGARAMEIFALAETKSMSAITRSRLLSMKAMVFMLPTELGQPDSQGITNGITALDQAMRIADQASDTHPMDALKAKLFAAHRLTGAASAYGTQEQKRFALDIIHHLYPLIDGNAELKYEAARLRYAEAVITADENPLLAAAKLVVSALQISDSSPLDRCGYLCLAAEFFYRGGELDLARAVYFDAATHEADLSKHANTAHTAGRLQKMRQLLNL
ncbi:MAG: hypothetical protein G01um101466_247 [Parcubacteria group bacterium Gr01-1014_66]|nr:MAG: hypothetical protein G01um101466_247 [Parcubacteria group bacterium Gr01-1014_66]